MWKLDCEEGWALKNWCFWTVVLEKSLECPLDCKEIQPVHSKGDQTWVFIGSTDAKAETPILWPPHANSWLIGKDSDAGRDWGQEEKGTTQDEMAGWHHRLDGREFGWTPGVGVGHEDWRAAIHGVTKSWTRLSDWTELNWTALKCVMGWDGGVRGTRMDMRLSRGVEKKLWPSVPDTGLYLPEGRGIAQTTYLNHLGPVLCSVLKVFITII